MSDAFVALDVFLSPPVSESLAAEPEPLSQPPAPPPCEWEAAGAARRFRAALADAVDLSLQRLLPQIAHHVLGRELAVAPADVAAIAGAALDRFANERILTLRIHASDAERVAGVGIPIVPDATLHPGDALLELHAGTIDMRLETRLACVLGAFEW